MKIIVALALFLILLGCVVTPGPTDINSLMAGYVSTYGPPSLIDPDINHKPVQTWTWSPLPNGKTLTIIAAWWRADWSENYAWRIASLVEK